RNIVRYCWRAQLDHRVSFPDQPDAGLGLARLHGAGLAPAAALIKVCEGCRLPCACFRLPLAKFLEHAFAQNIGIALASLGKFDDALGDELVGNDGVLRKTKCDAGHFECDADDPPYFWVGSSIVEEGRARHKDSRVQAGARPVSQPPGLPEPPPAVLKP